MAALTLVVWLVGASSCRVGADDVVVSQEFSRGPSTTNTSSNSPLPELGPVPGTSHWHAGYIVRICDDVLPPFESVEDPLGVHSHRDGVIHVHPFFEESGYESATLGLFADAVGLSLATGELTLPGGGTWRDGDLCGGVPGRVFVDRWRDPSDSQPERFHDDPQDLRFLADGELYQIAFAPADSTPVLPPSLPLLFELSPLPAVEVEPWVEVDPTAQLVRLWEVTSVTTAPCRGQQIAERVRTGAARCFQPGGEAISAGSAIEDARAVRFNRQPAVELRITKALRQVIVDHFDSTDDPMTLAIEIDGRVVTAPVIANLPVSETRLVVAGGFTEQTAGALATLLRS